MIIFERFQKFAYKKTRKISIFSLDYRVMPNIGDSARVIEVKGIGGKEETL